LLREIGVEMLRKLGESIKNPLANPPAWPPKKP
jgi:hypothetical protein